jgi:hypothetical protein
MATFETSTAAACCPPRAAPGQGILDRNAQPLDIGMSPPTNRLDDNLQSAWHHFDLAFGPAVVGGLARLTVIR